MDTETNDPYAFDYWIKNMEETCDKILEHDETIIEYLSTTNDEDHLNITSDYHELIDELKRNNGEMEVHPSQENEKMTAARELEEMGLVMLEKKFFQKGFTVILVE